jgi:hypothetical protein
VSFLILYYISIVDKEIINNFKNMILQRWISFNFFGCENIALGGSVLPVVQVLLVPAFY